MDYDPVDRAPTARQVLAAWAVCLGMAGLAVGLTAARHGLSNAAAADPMAAAEPGSQTMDGAQIPVFVLCQPDPQQRLVVLAQGTEEPLSPRIEHCG